ncbi:hypothetical protein BH11PSE4_BH11PSE4_06480 [soil metagenome]
MASNQDGPSGGIKDYWRWATTPPQAYGVYLACLVLVAVGSFYAGTLRPKKAVYGMPPVISAPPPPLPASK